MYKLKSFVLKEKKENYYTYAMMWNMIGSLSYAVSTPLLLIVITRLMGNDLAGIFSIAFSVSQLLLIVGNFEIRPLQSIDIKRKHSFYEYFSFRIITVIVMIACGLIYCIIESGSFIKKIIVVFLIIYRVSDCIGDVVEGEFQQRNQIYISGKLLFLRTLFPNIGMIIVAAWGLEIIEATAVFTLISVIIMIWEVNIIGVKKDIFRKIIHFNYKNIFIEAAPVFLISFFQVFVTNLPKYYIDIIIRDYSVQLIYSVLFMPVLVVNLVSGFIFKPYLVKITDNYSKNMSEFKKEVLGFTIFIIGVGIICTVGMSILGVPILEALYGKMELGLYKMELFFLMFGGCWSAVCTFLYHIVIIIDERKKMLVSYGCVAVVASVFDYFLIVKKGLYGSSIAYLGTFLLLAVFLFFIIGYKILRSSYQEIKNSSR